MRYCPNCKKEVNTVLTAGQAVTMLILLPLFPIFLIYCAAHERKCPFCKSPTYSLDNGSQRFDIFTYKKYIDVKKIMKEGKFVGYSFKGLQSDQYVYNVLFCMDKKRAIEIKLDKQGCCNYYFDFIPNSENTLLYYAEGRLTKKQ